MQTIDTITNGKSYRAWIKAWKAEYAELTLAIRQTKHAMKAASRANEPNPHMYKRRKLRGHASMMLSVLAEVKEAAREHRRQRLEEAA